MARVAAPSTVSNRAEFVCEHGSAERENRVEQGGQKKSDEYF
jgi:hypothetical protein